MQKNLYLDEYQDQDTFEKLVKVTNIGHHESEECKKGEMRDLRHACLTFDNRDILTIEMDSDTEAFIRSYILDEDVAEKEAYEAMLKEENISEQSSIKSMDSKLRKSYKWSIHIKDRVFLKIESISQNTDSSKFAVVYQDNGKFYIKMFDKQGKQFVNDFFINEEIGCDQRSVGMKICSTPLIVTSQFLPNGNLIFINLYHKKERCQYHFLFDYVAKCITQKGRHQFKKESHSSEMNYPVSSFYIEPFENDRRFYCFYRQGMVIEIDFNSDKLQDTSKDYQLMPREIDQICYANLRVDPDNPKSLERQFLICLYNCQVHFYTWNPQGQLFKYDTLKINDDASLELVQISYTHGDYRFQLIQENKIKIYCLEVRDDKFRPVLENTLYNFMKCSQLLLSKNGEFAVSYKHDQDNLYVYERKYFHDFEVKVDSKDYEGTIAKTLKGGFFVLGFNKYIQIYNKKKEVKESHTIQNIDDDLTIISMDVSHDYKRLAVGLGKVLNAADEAITDIIVFELRVFLDSKGKKDYEVVEIKRTETEFDADMSIEFKFSHKNIDHLMMFTKGSMQSFNYMTDAIEENAQGQRRSTLKKLYNIEGLSSQPDFVSFNKDQTKAIIASDDGLIFTSLTERQASINLASQYDIDEIKCVIYDEAFRSFFILANKRDHTVGLFLMSFNEDTK
jgi:hypothetical protein